MLTLIKKFFLPKKPLYSVSMKDGKIESVKELEKAKKVWLVWISDYDGEPIDSDCFSTREKADKYIEKFAIKYYEEHYGPDSEDFDPKNWEYIKKELLPSRLKKINFEQDFYVDVFDYEVL